MLGKTGRKLIDISNEYYRVSEVGNTTSGGLKYDNGKLLMSLIDPKFVQGVAEVLTFGANKYVPNSWQTVPDAKRRYEDALLRHTYKYLEGELKDEESGLDHLKHMACNIMFLLYLNRSMNDE